jgi:hypothetical protein
MQSSQSSATVAFRAIVMLAFIVVIPVAAFNKSALPEGARKFLGKIWPVITATISKTTSNILSEAPSYEAQPKPLLPLPGQNPAGIANKSSEVIPANYEAEIAPPLNGPTHNNSVPAESNPFLIMQERLRQLGATYYLLETWGNQRQVYRFYCQIAVGGNSSYTHYFEATNANPLEAMADVLRQVEAWRGASEAQVKGEELKNQGKLPY